MYDAKVRAAVNEFMRNVGHTAQKEIEKVVTNALASGKLKRSDELPADITAPGLVVVLTGDWQP